VFVDLIAMRIAVSVRAAQTIFFVRPHHHTYGATRTQAELLHDSDGMPCRYAAAGIIHGTRTHIP
jgi:hypothetical protein